MLYLGWVEGFLETLRLDWKVLDVIFLLWWGLLRLFGNIAFGAAHFERWNILLLCIYYFLHCHHLLDKSFSIFVTTLIRAFVILGFWNDLIEPKLALSYLHAQTMQMWLAISIKDNLISFFFGDLLVLLSIENRWSLLGIVSDVLGDIPRWLLSWAENLFIRDCHYRLNLIHVLDDGAGARGLEV